MEILNLQIAIHNMLATASVNVFAMIVTIPVIIAGLIYRAQTR